MQKLKIKLADGSVVFIPESNLTNFQRIHYGQVVSIAEPDENGEYPEDSFATSSTSVAIDGYRKENESLSNENEKLIEINETLTQQLSDASFENNRLTSENNGLTDENKRLFEQNGELKTEITALNFTIEKANEKYKALIEKINAAKAKKAEKTAS